MESLLLFRRALSSPTMCRFIPALSVPEKVPEKVSRSALIQFVWTSRRNREAPGMDEREVLMKLGRLKGYLYQVTFCLSLGCLSLGCPKLPRLC
jgi:hypothetical protein